MGGAAGPMEPPTGRDRTGRDPPGGPGSERVRGVGTMRWPEAVSLWGVLWLLAPLAGGRPVRLEKVRADTRNLTRTLSTRIQQLQLFPLGPRIRGLEALPGEGAPEGLGAISRRLQLLQRLLAQLATAGDQPLAQIANDTENLRGLLGAMAAQLGCPPPSREPPPAAPPEALAEAPHTVAGLALERLRGCLEGIAAGLEGHPPC